MLGSVAAIDMNETESEFFGFNRRDFLKSGSFATLMTMMGGVQLFAEPEKTSEASAPGSKVKIAVIGLATRGREILNVLAGLPQAEVASICDVYAPFLEWGAAPAPGGPAAH